MAVALVARFHSFFRRDFSRRSMHSLICTSASGPKRRSMIGVQGLAVLNAVGDGGAGFRKTRSSSRLLKNSWQGAFGLVMVMTPIGVTWSSDHAKMVGVVTRLFSAAVRKSTKKNWAPGWIVSEPWPRAVTNL